MKTRKDGMPTLIQKIEGLQAIQNDCDDIVTMINEEDFSADAVSDGEVFDRYKAIIEQLQELKEEAQDISVDITGIVEEIEESLD